MYHRKPLRMISAIAKVPVFRCLLCHVIVITNQAKWVLRVHQIHMGLEDSALSMSQLVCCNLICLFVSSLNYTMS